MDNPGLGLAVVAAFAVATAGLASPAFVVAQESGGEVEMTAGEEVSVLASAQEAQVRHDVEDRAWNREMDSGEAAFEDRVGVLQDRLDRVEERKAEIDERLESGEITERRAAALKAHAETEAGATNRSVDRMAARAQERGLNVTALEELKQRASEMTGQEVRMVAGNVAKGPPEDVGPRGAGPPGDAASNQGPSDDGTERGTPSDDGGDRGAPSDDGSSEDSGDEDEDNRPGDGDGGGDAGGPRKPVGR